MAWTVLLVAVALSMAGLAYAMLTIALLVGPVGCVVGLKLAP